MNIREQADWYGSAFMDAYYAARKTIADEVEASASSEPQGFTDRAWRNRQAEVAAHFIAQRELNSIVKSRKGME